MFPKNIIFKRVQTGGAIPLLCWVLQVDGTTYLLSDTQVAGIVDEFDAEQALAAADDSDGELGEQKGAGHES